MFCKQRLILTMAAGVMTAVSSFGQLKPEAWRKTDKGCAFYHPYSTSQTIVATWSGQCNASNQIEGKGTLLVSRKGDDGAVKPFIKFVGTYTAGVLSGRADAFLFVRKINDYRIYYSGDYAEGLRHGKGKYIYYDNESPLQNSYDGDWVKGKREGKGRYYVNEQEYFESAWVNDAPAGEMIYRFSSTEYYKGQQKNGIWEGQGTYFMADGTRFEGLWKNGDLVKGTKLSKEGSVLETIDDSDIYQFASLQEEKDIVAEQAGDRSIFTRIFKGEKKKDEAADFLGTDTPAEKPNEYAKVDPLEEMMTREKEKIKSQVAVNEGTWYTSEKTTAEVWMPKAPVAANSANWTGKVVDGKGNGPGLLILYRVNEFDLDKPIPVYKIEGTLVKGKFQGMTKEFVLNEQSKAFELVFEGEYAEGYRNGPGVAYENKQIVSGDFFYNTIIGPASFTFENGDAFDGVLLKGKMEGRGVLAKGDGTVVEGEWNGGKLSGFATMAYPDGSKYKGNVLNDKYEGQGSLFKSSGGRLEGVWAAGKLVNGVETDARGKTTMKYKNGKTIQPGRGWRTVGAILTVAAAVAVTAASTDAALNATPSTNRRPTPSVNRTNTATTVRKPACRYYIHFARGSNDVYWITAVMKIRANCTTTLPQGKVFSSFEEAQSFREAKWADAEMQGYEPKLRTINNPCGCN